ncbi:MAG: cation:proton antiporter [Deltaproteobacteria bacterium]|nr:cation:proton antiporter [Deltaproteobacteria bacterium]
MTRLLPLALALSILFPSAALAAGEDPSLPLLLFLVLILLTAKLMGHVSVLLGQPPVLGELCAGILLGNLGLIGIPAAGGLAADSFVDIFARIGVVILLFQVGLESTVRDIMKVGFSSLLVAVLGVIAPFGLGWLVGAWLLPGESAYVHAFLGATLCATSVGITARVLQDIGKSREKEARIILGAAVIDDVLGLIVLASVSGIILAADAGGQADWMSTVMVVLKAVGFLAGSLLLGTFLTPRLFRQAARLRGPGVLLGVSLAFCFLLAYLAGLAGLAPIVGAFAAGLILEPVHFQQFGDDRIHSLEEGLTRLAEFLVPVFFVAMGAKVDLRAFASADALLLALALTVAAVVGKQICSLGVVGRGLNRWAVGIGMIPRGEVGLIFAGIGMTLVLRGEPVVDAATYSAVVMMVFVTTLVTPPLLKRAMRPRAAANGSTTGDPS